jgi:hypothetical protein
MKGLAVARWMLAVVACAAVVAYARVIHAPFLAWDDDRNILLNPFVRSGHIGALWAAPWFGLYVPVTSTAWAGLWHLGDGAAWPFRAYNLAVHLASTMLVWRLLLRLGRTSSADPGLDVAAAIGATVFALHPLQSAAVAWISGGRDVTATFLALAAVVVWLRFTRAAALTATALFAAALLAKPSVATVPLAVLVLAWAGGRVSLRRAAPAMLAWIALAGTVAWLSARVQSDMATVTVALSDRPVVAIDAFGFYLMKLVAPVGLSADHGRTPPWLLAHADAIAPTFLAVAAVASAAFMWRRRGVASWVLAWAVLLGPVAGLVTFSFQRISTVADHYAYLPMVAVAGAAAVLVRPAVERWRVAALVLWGVAVIAATAATWSRAGVWTSDAALFGEMVGKNPDSFSGLTNLAKLACDAGDTARGAALAARALALEPANPPTLATRADCLYRAGAFDAVVAMRSRIGFPSVQYALARDDAAAASFVNSIAGALFQTGRLRDGLSYLCQAVAIRPGDDYLQANLHDVVAEFRRRGLDAQCGGRLSWRDFAAQRYDSVAPNRRNSSTR